MKVIYTAKVHTTGGGREGGTSRSDDGNLDIKLSLPGTHGDGTNPEQLLAAGWSACYTSAIKILASQKKIKLPAELSTDAEIDLCQGDGGYSLSARLNVSMPGIDREVGQELIEGAHQICPYSKSLRGTVPVELKLL